MCFSESIAHDTLFSQATRYVSLLPIHAERKAGTTMKGREWSSLGGVVFLEGESLTPGKVFRRPRLLRRPGDQRRVSELLCLGTPGEIDSVVRLRSVDPNGIEIEIESPRALPDRIVPTTPVLELEPLARKESGQ
jgi:hypothetical protein